MSNLTGTPSAANIVAFFDSACDAADASAGVGWYPDAYAFAYDLATEHSIAVAQAVGVIAAFSPLNEWEQNKADAARFLATGARVHTEAFMGKARRILAGEDILTVLHSAKISNFWLSIMTRGAEGVCIDRHAYDIALSTRHPDGSRSIGVKAYQACAEAYADAARILSARGIVMSPAEVQSTTWEAWRKLWKHVRVTEPVPYVPAALAA